MMRKRTLYTGLLILVAVIALGAAMVQLRVRHGPMFYAVLRTASGLRDGAGVSFRGVPVGEVTNIAIAPNAVRLTITLNRSDVPLRQGDGARVRHNSVLSEAELELVPMSRPGPALREGAVLPEVAPDPASLRRDAVERGWLRAIGQATGVTIERDSGVGRKAVP